MPVSQVPAGARIICLSTDEHRLYEPLYELGVSRAQHEPAVWEREKTVAHARRAEPVVIVAHRAPRAASMCAVLMKMVNGYGADLSRKMPRWLYLDNKKIQPEVACPYSRHSDGVAQRAWAMSARRA